MERRAFIVACIGATLSTTRSAFAEPATHQTTSPSAALEALGSNPSYDDLVSYAQTYLAEIDDPQHMSETAENEISLLANGSPYWSSSDKGSKMFFDGHGDIWLSSAHKIIDVSSWQGTIDWNKAATEIDGAILRMSYGIGYTDDTFQKNLSECKRLKIPFGIYHYSYAYNSTFAYQEAQWINTLFSRYGVNKDTPVFYDLESFSPFGGHYPPTSVGAYEGIVDSFFNTLSSYGFTNLHVYSYRSYLTTGPLNSSKIRSLTSWVAEYNPTLSYSFSTASGIRGWQYTSSESVAGISGYVDMSAFSTGMKWAGLYPYGFPDVYSWTPHADDILWLKENGIANGYGNGYYGTYDQVQREQMAAFMYRIAGEPEYSPSNEDRLRFPDVDEATPHAKEIWWLGYTGIAEGYGDGNYGPYDPITREQMAAFLYRLAGSPEFQPSDQNMSKFPDVNEETPHAKEIWWMGACGLSTGYEDNGGIYGPFLNILRLDMAAFLHRWSNMFAAKTE